MDSKLMISDAARDIARAAKHLGVDKWVVAFAKHVTQTNIREDVYRWVELNKDEVNKLSGFFSKDV